MERSFGRSPTFLVGTVEQKNNLEQLQRREQHLAEEYQKNKPLMYIGNAYQKTHPQKAANPGHRDADCTVVSPMLLGCADGVSQIEEFGMDSSQLPRELLDACQELAMAHLLPDHTGQISGSYRGPIHLMREAFLNTEALGSTTVCLSILDNTTRIHGKLHPMIAVCSIGDCELLILRKSGDYGRPEYDIAFNTEMQRIEGNCQCPLQVSRLDERVDPNFEERMTVQVIEKGSAVHMVSVYEGDLVVIGSDGLFDNLFHDEVVAIINEMILNAVVSGDKAFRPLDQELLGEIARRIVEACHIKTKLDPRTGIYPDTPIGKGGKRDDTCCVVGEVVEFTESDSQHWEGVKRQKRMKDLITCGGIFSVAPMCAVDDDEDELSGNEEESNIMYSRPREAREYQASPSFYSEDEEEKESCSVM